MREMSFRDFKERWETETIMEGIFGLDQDFSAIIDEPDLGSDNPTNERYNDVLIDYLFEPLYIFPKHNSEPDFVKNLPELNI